MITKPIVLKMLLRHHHLWTYRAFCREYDRIAAAIDPTLLGGWPSKAQFYRWLSGEKIDQLFHGQQRQVGAVVPTRRAAPYAAPDRAAGFSRRTQAVGVGEGNLDER